MSQFSLFGAAAAEPSLDDLDGVLLAGGHWVRTRRGARLSVVVAERWRADALAAAFAAAGSGRRRRDRGRRGRLRRSARPSPPSSSEHAARWSRGANRPAAGVRADRRRAAAVGDRSRARDEVGYLLDRPRRTTRCTWPPARSCRGSAWPRCRSASAAGPGWRVTSARNGCAGSPSWSAPPPRRRRGPTGRARPDERPFGRVLYRPRLAGTSTSTTGETWRQGRRRRAPSW